MKVLWELEPAPRRNLLILFTAGLFFWASLASLLATLPSYVKDIGGNNQQIGFVMGAFAIGLLLCRSWLGKVADRSSRKQVLLIGTCVAAIAPFGYLLLKSIPLLLIIRIFHGTSVAAFTTGYSALVVDLSPISKRGEVIGYMSLVAPIGMAIGPAVGGLVENVFGYSPLFLMSATLGIISLLSIFQIKEAKLAHLESHHHTGNSPQVNHKSWQLLAAPRLLIPTLVLLIIGFAFGAVITFIPLFIRETRIDFNAGLFYTIAAIASFMIRIFTGRASDKYGRGLFITGSLVAYLLAMLILSQAHSAIAFILAGILEGAGSGTLLPMMITLISDRSFPQERGQVFSLCLSGFDLGLAISGPVFGTFAEKLGYQGIFTISTGLSLLALTLFITKSNKSLSESCNFALGKSSDIYAINP